MGVYINRNLIRFSKSAYKCPHCGNLKYHRVTYNGVEIVNDAYGCCWTNHGCFTNTSKFGGTLSYPTDEFIRSYFNLTDSAEQQVSIPQAQPKSLYHYLKSDISKYTVGNIDYNNLFKYLRSIGLDYADSVSKYKVCSFVENNPHYACYMQDKVLFWLISIDGEYCDGKEICYGTDGHRRKYNNLPDNLRDGSITYTSTRTAYIEASKQRYTTKNGDELKRYMSDFKQRYEFRRVLFGEHLLANQQGEPILLFEAEKTAVIMDAYCRMNGKKVICLALGGKSMYTADKLKWLQGRNVTYIPDTDTLSVCTNEDGNPEQEIDILHRRLRQQNSALADSIKICKICWVPSSTDNSILRVKQHEIDALLQAKGVKTIQEAKLDFADVVCWRLEHQPKQVEELPFPEDTVVHKPKVEYVSPLSTNKDY